MPDDRGTSSGGARDRQAEWRGKMMATLEGLHERVAELRGENADEHKELRAATDAIRDLVSENKSAIAVLQLRAGFVGLVGGMIPAAVAVLIVLLKGWAG